MRWEEGETSRDIEDRRGSPGRRFPGGAAGGIGAVIVLLVGLFFGVDVSGLFSGGGRGSDTKHDPIPADRDDERKLVKFVSFVLDDAQKTWAKKFKEMGERYQRTKLVLYRRGTPTAGCGYGSAAVGPFYCPADKKVYLDFAFFNVMAKQLGANGEFAQAYVLAHEIGHHVQTLLGAGEANRRRRKRSSRRQSNRLSVMFELQADCYAGIWAHSTGKRGIVNDADIADGIRAAKAIGDDTVQKRAGRQVAPESFQHGSAAQRVEWFKRGQQSGRLEDCDTFSQMR